MNYWLNIDYNLCVQSELDKLHPGENLTCIHNTTLLQLLMKDLEIQVLIQSTYFDSNSYADQPIKKTTKTYVFSSGNTVEATQYFAIRPNFVTMSDSPFGSALLGSRQENFTDVLFSYTDIGDRDVTDPLAFGRAYQLMFTPSDEIVIVNRNVYTIFNALSSTGGISGIIMGVIGVLVAVTGWQANLFFAHLSGKMFLYSTFSLSNDVPPPVIIQEN